MRYHVNAAVCLVQDGRMVWINIEEMFVINIIIHSLLKFSCFKSSVPAMKKDEALLGIEP